MFAAGDQVQIESGTQRAVVASVGATLRRYAFGDRALLDGFDASEVCPAGCGQLLAPWPNRVAGGHYDFAGAHHQLPIDELALGNAIHGLVRWEHWRVERRRADRARLVHRLCARPGYPFALDLAVDYRLARAGLVVTFRAENLGDTRCPFGFGAHPYLFFPGASAEAIELFVPAREWIEVDEHAIPTGRKPVFGTPLDFNEPHAIGSARIDHAYTGLERDREDVAEVRLRHAGDEIRLWQDRELDFVQIYTGDTLPELERRRRSVAVEPMSCAPDAFNSGDGLRVLAPGDAFECRWGITLGSS